MGDDIRSFSAISFNTLNALPDNAPSTVEEVDEPSNTVTDFRGNNYFIEAAITQLRERNLAVDQTVGLASQNAVNKESGVEYLITQTVTETNMISF